MANQSHRVGLKLCISLLAVSTLSCIAAVEPDQVTKLGNELTPLGGEMAGNVDGSIPEWQPNSTPPTGFDPNSGFYPNPWPGEQPLYEINASNMQEHATMLTEGSKALLQKFGTDGYVMKVYPSRRSYFAPDWFYSNTAKNAVNTTLKEAGLKVDNNLPGTPFPIPANGLEAVWNHMVRFGTPSVYKYDVYYVGADGDAVLATTAEGAIVYPMFDNPNEIVGDNAWAKLRIDYLAPPRRAGEKLLVHEPGANYTGSRGRTAWQYLTGQRRVRLAPAVAFDTPNPAVAGTSTYDDAMIYNGSPERFNWTLVGKQELLIPYNNYDFVFKYPVEELLGSRFIKPDHVRWEKHRVWVLEADLKEGVRHIYNKRRLYLDEDSWTAISSETWDNRGNLWRVQFSYSASMYDTGGMAGASGAYDLLQNIYNLNGKPIPGEYHRGVEKDGKYFTSSALSMGGTR